MAVPKGRPRNIHPFPARMAPEVALAKIDELTEVGQRVLDPMCGSGTVVRLAREADRVAFGCDLDPLAVAMTRTACNPAWASDLATRADVVLAEAMAEDPSLPDWIEADSETTEFVRYWFAHDQRGDLARIAKVLRRRPQSDDPLRIALSRVIVTKDGGASLARDTSHSRPHKVRDDSDFDVEEGFLQSAERLGGILDDLPAGLHSASVRSVDARQLSHIGRGKIDLVVTSPPYLNALDYLRGHRLSLVWFGRTLSEVRDLRGTSIGAERILKEVRPEVAKLAERAVPKLSAMSNRDKGMTLRFVADMDRLCRSMSRVLRSEGHLVFVVADSQIRGVPVSNSSICRLAAAHHGFSVSDEAVRPLPSRHRYLPPPESGDSQFASRMREEVVLTFLRSASAA